jgi:hypothetical protein
MFLSFHFCRIAVSNCQVLYFLEDTATPILRIVALRPVMVLPPDILARLSKVHHSKVGHWGLGICKRRLREAHQRQGERDITDLMISEFIRQCPACQVMSRTRLQIKAHRFTCVSYNLFEVLHLDHIGSLTRDEH